MHGVMLNDVDFERSFWARVDIGPGCWEWMCGKNSQGYGCVRRRGRYYRAHRIAWTLVFGAPPTKFVCHHCDNPACCRPSHLFEGSGKDNARDRDLKGRNGSSNKTHCVRGHEFSVENTVIDTRGRRACVTCNTIRAEHYRARGYRRVREAAFGIRSADPQP